MDGALRWWQTHRPAAPHVLVDEIDNTLELIARAPLAGRQIELRGHPNVRRLLLRRSNYHLYYRIDAEDGDVQLLAFRHARRKPRRLLR